MTDKKKALTSTGLCPICALIWIIVCFVNFRKLVGTTLLILIICAAIASITGAVAWFIRYLKLDKSNEYIQVDKGV